MAQLTNKRALITGGASGIGLETARLFVAEGARVAITARSAASFAAVREEFGDAVLCLTADAASPDQTALAARIQSAFGQLDVLFLNAGIAELKPVEAWTPEAFDHTIRTNLSGPFFLIQALLPLFANPASLILNASINAHLGMPNTSVYGASKAALLSFARTLSGELIGRGIRVNAVSPGPIETPLYSKLGLSAQQLDSVAAALQSQVPAHRFGRPREVASAVAYLASDDSAYMVGSEMIIDGGLNF